MRTHRDGRAMRYCDIFAGLPGDVNVFELYPMRPSGWHRHERQTDQFFVAAGEVIVGTWTGKAKPSYRLLWTGDTLTIEPGTWHGYCAPSGAVLVMYLNQHYDPTDEEATSFEDVPWAVPNPLLSGSIKRGKGAVL